MTWIKVDVDSTEHPKCVGLSDAAWTVWIHGLTYAGRNLSDGFIPAGMLNRLCNTRNPRKAVDELVRAGLWDTAPDGWLIHDYLEHQRSSDSVVKHKKASSKGAIRANHNQHHVRKGVSDPACDLCQEEQSLLSDTDRATDPPTTPPLSVNGQQSKRDIPKDEDAAKAHHQQTVVAVSDSGGGSTSNRTDAAIESIADYELMLAQASGVEPEKTWAAYRAGIVKRINRCRGDIDELAAAWPDDTPDELRDRYHGTAAYLAEGATT